MTDDGLITGQRQTWDVQFQLAEEDGKPVILGEALHPGNFQNGRLPITKEMIQRSAKSFEGVDLIAGHPPINDPSPPDKIFGTVTKVFLKDDGTMMVKGTPDENAFAKRQITNIEKGRLKLSIGADPIYKQGSLFAFSGDHIATVRKKHAEDKDTTIKIAMSKINDELIKLGSNGSSQGRLNNMSEEEDKQNSEDQTSPLMVEMAKKVEKQEAQLALLMAEKTERTITLATTMIATLLQFATNNGLEDRTKELGDLDPKQVKMSSLQDLEIAMLKEVLGKQTKMAKDAKQKQVQLGKTGSGAGADPPSDDPDKKDQLQMAAQQFHSLLRGDRPIIVKKGAEFGMADDYIMEGVDSKGGYMVAPELAQQIIDNTRKETFLANYYSFYTMKTNVLNVPKILSGLMGDVKHIGETGAYGDTPTWSAGQKTMTARKFMTQHQISTELDEDWSVESNAMAKLMELIGNAFREALEYAVIFGNTTTYPPGSSTDIRALCDGIYKTTPAAHVNNIANAAMTIDLVRAQMADIEDSGAKVEAMIMNPRLASQMKKFKETETIVQMIEGGNARKIAGRVAILDGADVLSSRLMPITAGTPDVGDIIFLGEGAGSYGAKRDVRMFQEYVSNNDVNKLTTTARWGWIDLTEEDDATSRFAILQNVKAED